MSGAKRRKRASPGGPPPPVSEAAVPGPAVQPRLDDLITALQVVVYRGRLEGGDFVLTWADGAVEEFLGYTADEIVGDPEFARATIHPDDLVRVPASIEELLASGRMSFEYRVRHRDGSVRWIHNEGTLVEDETGRHVVGGWTDVTRRVAATAALERRARADRVISRIARRFLEATDDDVDRLVLEALEQAAELFDLDSGQVYLLRDDGGTMDATHEWLAQGAVPGLRMTGAVRLSQLPHAVELMNAASPGVLAVPRLGDVFPEGLPERSLLAPEVESFYVVPLTDAADPIGYVGFTAQRRQLELDDEDIAIVVALAEIITGAMVRRRLARALRDSEERRLEMARAAHVGTWRLDLAEPAAQWSEEMYHILGLDAGGQPSTDLLWERIHPDDRERVSAARAEAVESGFYSCDHRIVLPNGSERVVRDSGWLEFDERGRPAAFLGSIQDISDQVRSLQAAVEAQLLLSTFAEAIGGEAFIKDREGRYLMVNSVFERTWGVVRADVVGRDDACVFGPEIAARLREADQRIMETRRPEEYLHHGATDGRPYVWRTHKAAILDDSGEVAGVCGVGFDVTVEQEAAEAVRVSEARLAAILAAIPDAVTIVDRDCVVLWANGAAAGLVASDPLGRRWNELVRGSSERCPGCDMDRIIATGNACQHEYEAGSAAGGSRTLWASCSLWDKGDSGQPISFLTITRDITERKEFERGLAEVRAGLEREVGERMAEIERSRMAALSLMQDANLERERAEKALAQHETLLREVHHRVKNNLNTVANILYFQSRTLADEKARHAFEDSQDRIKSMARIHEHLYRSWDIASVDMSAYLQDLVDDLGQVHGTGELSFAVDAAGVSLDIDRAVPCGLLVNELLTNACKHAFPQGGGHVEVRLSREDGRCRLQVSDDGVGLPDGLEIAATTSLGLRLGDMLARQLGGDLVVDSAPGRGTAFSITFPAGETRNER